MTPLDKLTPLQRWGACCPDDPECDHSHLDDGFLKRHMNTPLSDFEAELVTRGWSTDVLLDIQAALPEGHYLGREGVVRAKVRTYCASHGSLHTGWGGWTATVCPNGIGCSPFRLHAITPVEADQ